MRWTTGSVGPDARRRQDGWVAAVGAPMKSAASLVIVVALVATLTSCASEPADSSSTAEAAASAAPSTAATWQTTPVSPSSHALPAAVETSESTLEVLADTDAVAAEFGVARPMNGSRPSKVWVPAIGVDSPLLDLGLQEDGSLEVPPDASGVGWFTGGPTPGELGPAVIVGHVDWAGQPGVFYNLRDLSPGDDITVSREDGSVAHFKVRSTEQFAKSEFPTSAVYGNIDHPGLRLITCGGSYDASARSYLDNIIVFAELVEAPTG